MTKPYMTMFVVYAKPLDFPESWVARRWDLVMSDDGAEIKIVPAEVPHAVAPDLESVRAALPRGLHRLRRFAEDDPAISEVWL